MIGCDGKFPVRDVGDEVARRDARLEVQEREGERERKQKPRNIIANRKCCCGADAMGESRNAGKQRCSDGPTKARSSRRAGGEGCRGEKERKREKKRREEEERGAGVSKGTFSRAPELCAAALCCGARAAVWAL